VTGEPGFGIYVHWPFCLAKCPYCDFNSHVRHRPVDEARFGAALSREIAHMAELAPGRRVLSVFFGGGTPSLMSPGTVATVLDAIARHWSLDAEIEVTLEANPTSVEAGRFRGYREAGVNRVSLGVQALHDADLEALGRRHSVSEALAAVDLARGIFPRLSFDLIYARPGQSVAAWRAELEAAMTHAADHLSLYQLTIEPGTPFHALHAAGKLQVPEPELARALYEATQDVTEAHGLPAYEISNHARPGAECRHNLVYWRYGEYAGVGPGAHGRLIVRGVRRALATERVPEAWLERVEQQGHGITEDEPLDREAQGDEMLLMGLRLKEGVDLTRYRMMTGRPIDPARLTLLAADGFVEPAPGGRLRATPEAWPVLDAVVADLAA
jgi:oxygen-independent coproporphyrinogen-3 oxidase